MPRGRSRPLLAVSSVLTNAPEVPSKRSTSLVPWLPTYRSPFGPNANVGAVSIRLRGDNAARRRRESIWPATRGTRRLDFVQQFQSPRTRIRWWSAPAPSVNRGRFQRLRCFDFRKGDLGICSWFSGRRCWQMTCVSRFLTRRNAGGRRRQDRPSSVFHALSQH